MTLNVWLNIYPNPRKHGNILNDGGFLRGEYPGDVFFLSREDADAGANHALNSYRGERLACIEVQLPDVAKIEAADDQH